MSVVEHQLADSIQDCVIGSMVCDGLGMRCGACRKGCVIEMPKGRFTRQSDVQGQHFYCPYCGTAGTVTIPRMIHDTRPIGED